MLYELVKVAHLLGWVMWLGGLILLLQALSFGTTPSPPLIRATRVVTGAGIALAWLGGLTMAFWGGWYLDPWFLVKLAIVFGLSGLHGVIIGRLGRGEAIPSSAFLALHFAGLLVVATLALAKPF